MNLRGDKSGSEKYYIIISLILGIMVLALVLWFIFFEYFTEDELDWEACRQSIVLRDVMPETTLLGVLDISTKDYMPLKCKTQVITLTDEKMEEAQRKIMDTMAACWYLVGEGEYRYFATGGVDVETRCIVCARIHIDQKYQEDYKKNPIDLVESFRLERKGSDEDYWDSLNRGRFQAFPIPKIWAGDKFEVIYGGHLTSWHKKALGAILGSTGMGVAAGSVVPGLGHVVGGAAGAVSGGISVLLRAGYEEFANAWNTLFNPKEIKPKTITIDGQTATGPGFVFPKYFDGGRGDLFIVVSSPATKDENNYHPYMYFLPQDDLGQLKEPINTYGGRGKNDPGSHSFVPCSSYESVPA